MSDIATPRSAGPGDELRIALAALAARLDSSEKAVSLLHEDQVRVPTMLDREIAHVSAVIRGELEGHKNLVAERFNRVETMFSSNATALTAALSAAERAVGEQNRSSSLAITKAEQGMLESIKQLGINFQTKTEALSAIVAGLQSRIDRGDGVDRGAHDTRTERRLDTGTIIGIAAIFLSALAIIFHVLK